MIPQPFPLRIVETRDGAVLRVGFVVGWETHEHPYLPVVAFDGSATAAVLEPVDGAHYRYGIPEATPTPRPSPTPTPESTPVEGSRGSNLALDGIRQVVAARQDKADAADPFRPPKRHGREVAPPDLDRPDPSTG